MIQHKPDEPCAALFEAEAYLVARGVRALALVGRFTATGAQAMIRLATLVEEYGQPGTTPFVIDLGNGNADCGYAAASWVLDLYRWAVTDDAVPERQRARIVGLLFGYNADAIRSFEEDGAGRLFATPTACTQRPGST